MASDKSFPATRSVCVDERESVRRARDEAELSERHKEQFHHLRTRIKSLETEASIASAEVKELRRKQQTLLESKRYADAFEHMKLIKRAELEAMRAYREEQREVNEESVKHLIETQAAEREEFRRAWNIEMRDHNMIKASTLASARMPSDGFFEFGSTSNVNTCDESTGLPLDCPKHLIYDRTVPHESYGAEDSAKRKLREDYQTRALAHGGRNNNVEAQQPDGYLLGEEPVLRKNVCVDSRDLIPETAHSMAYDTVTGIGVTRMDDHLINASKVSTHLSISNLPFRSITLHQIPDAWQSTAVNTRPTTKADYGDRRLRETSHLENAAHVLLNAALTLVGGADAIPPDDDRSVRKMMNLNSRGLVNEGGDAWTFQQRTSRGTNLTRNSITATEEETVKIGTHDSSLQTNNPEDGSQMARVSDNDTQTLPHLEEESEDDVEDVPLAVPHKQVCGGSGHIVPGIDFSRLQPSKSKSISRGTRAENVEAAVSGQHDRGLQKFLNPSNRNSSVARIDHNHEGQDGRNEAKILTVGTKQDDNTFNFNNSGKEKIGRDRKVAAAKLLMQSASKRPADSLRENLIVAPEDEQHARSSDRSGSAASLKSTSREIVEIRGNTAETPEFSGYPDATAQNKVLKAQRESRKAVNQNRQFTTEDFRNLFSFSRHGKYKQVISRTNIFSYCCVSHSYHFPFEAH